ncbi:hypothetical protein SAPIO_CDS7501 [Scedosporium apiospermum]|uniref:Uncharacterized protein n=1 Tax=Pseudallescheria apiosperma TaxID=563466 RepID=A0A084G218_PSEDA|nr:uncharacterized protein SAPIO_CDS7501 [Scedosporium apiospermum]KEZ41380.1 hypothetical protein SAPIO_CDS7501 [Scedosporium apiospermum]
MRGLTGTALAVLPVLSGLGYVNAQETATALIPLDLGDYGFDRELTLLFTLFESDKPCGLSNIQLNGQSLATLAGHSGRETIFEDYGSEVITNWVLQCIDVDDKPVRESITIQIDSIDGTHLEDVIFTVNFHQSSPVAILSVDGQATSAPILDISSTQRDFWAPASENDDPDSEVQAAIEEIQLLRYQQREIAHRIKELESFVRQSESGNASSCRGKVRCIMKHFLDRVAGIAAKAYSNVVGSDSDSAFKSPNQTSLHGDGEGSNESSTRLHIPLRRPSWRPLFCPCSPDDSTSHLPKTPSDDSTLPPLPITPPLGDDSPSNPDNSTQIPGDDGGIGNGKPGDSEPDSKKGGTKPIQSDGRSNSSPTDSLMPALVFMMIVASIFCAVRYRRRIAEFHQERRRRRLERHRRRREAALAFVRRLIPGLPNQRCTDMEQQQQQQQQQHQQHYQQVDIPDVPEPTGEMQQRTRRSQSDASNTMEQDLAQLRAAVAMVDNLVAGGDAMRETAVVDRELDPLLTSMRGRRGSMRESAGFAEYSYPAMHHDLPPAYESEEEGSSAMPAISDGFRRGQGMTPYSPGYGTSTARSSADELGYRKP